ncbi:MAG TPA: hypothetical protein VGC15_13100 [Acetobacteraceae bacterium]
MANQPETSTFPDVHQWEVTEPVQGGVGGVANLPLLQLTARTRYILDIHNALLPVVNGKAPNDSPTFTGSPQAPTPASTAAGTEVITAAWARGLAGNVTSVTVGGNTLLTAAQAFAGAIIVNGNPTADFYLLFPPGPGKWYIANLTPFHLLARLAGGGNTTFISAGHTKPVFTDGFNFADGYNDFENVTLTGQPQAPVAPPGDDGTAIANTFWVTRAIAPLAPILSPAFQGVPLTPSPPDTDDSGAIPNTNWLRRIVAGLINAALGSFVTNNLRAFPGEGYIKIGPLMIQTITTGQVPVPVAPASQGFDIVFPQPFPNGCIWMGGVDGGASMFNWNAFSAVTRFGARGYVSGSVQGANAEGHLIAVGW